MPPRAPTPKKYWLAGATAGLAAVTLHDQLVRVEQAGHPALAGISWRSTAAPVLHTFHHDFVLGTSLDLLLDSAHPGDAHAAEQHLLAEVERLRRILSTYDPASEISRLGRAGASAASPELARLLAAYDEWARRTGGALSPRLGAVGQLWKTAAQTGRRPEPAALRAALAAPGALNVDALGKSFILDHAVAVARRFAPAGLVNLGGDLRAWGEKAWEITVADPRHPADNAPPLARFLLRDAALAVSGGYARYYEMAGARHSHLLDPRTLEPLPHLVSAAVSAADSLTANALATAACVLGPALAGDDWLPRHGALAHLLTDAAGLLVRTRGFLPAVAVDPAAPATPAASVPPPAGTPIPPPPPPPPAASPASATSGWAKNFQVTLNVALKNNGGKRQYVAIWVQDAQQQLVRTIALWGRGGQYMIELNNWWKFTNDGELFAAKRAAATRPAGKYVLVWDGLDDQGQPIAPGEYHVYVEIDRENGHHITQSVKITFGAAAQSFDLPATTETDGVKITYGPAAR